MTASSFLKLVVPELILRSFDLVELKESPKFFEFILEEKATLIPPGLKGEVAVLDGFCNPLSLLTFPQQGLPTYLVIKRRRWKLQGGSPHYSNTYDFHEPGVKATREFAAFLKEVHGHTPDEYLRVCGIDGS